MKLIPMIALAFIACTPVMAKPPCMDRADALKLLSDKHGEKTVARGLFPAMEGVDARTGLPVIDMWIAELLVSEDRKTWTMIITNKAGRSCQYGHGTDWENVDPEYGVKG